MFHTGLVTVNRNNMTLHDYNMTMIITDDMGITNHTLILEYSIVDKYQSSISITNSSS